MGSKMLDISHSNIFLTCHLGQGKQRKNKPTGLHQTKTFLHGKGNIIFNKMKRQPTDWRNILTNDTLGKGLMSKIFRKTYKTQHQKKKKKPQKTPNPKQSNFKMGKGPEQTLLQRGHTDGQ